MGSHEYQRWTFLKLRRMSNLSNFLFFVIAGFSIENNLCYRARLPPSLYHSDTHKNTDTKESKKRQSDAKVINS